MAYKSGNIRPEGIIGGTYYPDNVYDVLLPRLNLQWILAYSIEPKLFCISKKDYNKSTQMSSYEFDLFLNNEVTSENST